MVLTPEMSTCCLSNPEIGNLEVLHKIKQIGTTGSTTGTTTNIYDFLIMTS